MIQQSCYIVKSLAKILELSLGNDPRQTKGESMSESTKALKRIADAMEEILRLVKKDQEDSASRQRQRDAE